MQAKICQRYYRYQKKVVALARLCHANVEAELGYVAKLGQPKEKLGCNGLEEAARFVNESFIDGRAVAIGSAHGFYKEVPKLEFERLSKIHHRTDVALVAPASPQLC